jgi:hypothetical protein
MKVLAIALVAAACIASVFFYGDFETAFGERFIEGYHVHHRVDPAVGAYDEPPVLVISTHAKHWYGLAAVWGVRVAYVALLFGLPFLTWRVMSS